MYRLNELSAAITRKQQRLGLTQYEAARQIGLSVPTLSRLLIGNTATLKSYHYADCCRWLGVPFARFIEMGDCIAYGKDQAPIEIIIDLINRDPEIDEEKKQAFVEMFNTAYWALVKK